MALKYTASPFLEIKDMKKIILIIILLFNVLPHIKNNKLLWTVTINTVAQENSSGTEEVCEELIAEIYGETPGGETLYHDCRYFRDCETGQEVQQRSCGDPYTCEPEEEGEPGGETEEGSTRNFTYTDAQGCDHYDVSTFEQYVNGGGMVPGTESTNEDVVCNGSPLEGDNCDIFSPNYNPSYCDDGGGGNTGGGEGGGGPSPGGGGPSGGTSSYPSASYIIGLLNITEFAMRQYLMEHTAIADAIASYADGPESPQEKKDFIAWATEYFYNNPSEIGQQEPTPVDLLKIAKIIRNYDSKFFGLIQRSGPFLDDAVKSQKSNFKYPAFWRLAHGIGGTPYTGALGIIGEGISAYKEYSFFNSSLVVGVNGEKGDPTYVPPYQGMSGTWDFEINYYAKTSGVLIEGLNLADGTPYNWPNNIAAGSSLSIYYEVKTISSNNSATNILTYLRQGVTQTINNLQQNQPTSTNMSMAVLYFEKDAYLKLYAEDPINTEAEYARLVSGGGTLHLRKDLLTSTQTAVNELILLIKNNTSK